MYNDKGYETKGLAGNSRLNQGADSPEVLREAGPIGKANETIGYLNELEGLHIEICKKLYGPFPTSNSAGEKRAEPPSLEEMLQMICRRVAGLTGDAKNLLSRLD